MSLIRKHGAVLQAWACLDLVKLGLSVLRSSADLQSYDSEFQTEAALTLNAFADNASVICTENNSYFVR